MARCSKCGKWLWFLSSRKYTVPSDDGRRMITVCDECLYGSKEGGLCPPESPISPRGGPVLKRETHYPGRDAMLRYLESYVRISELKYSGPAGEVQDDLDTINKEPHWWCPLIVPAEAIEDISALMMKDFEWWVFRGENVPGYESGQMLLTIDFDVGAGERALTFGFVYPEDETWLRALVNAKRVAILESPGASTIMALTLEFGENGLVPVEKWLESCSAR